MAMTRSERRAWRRRVAEIRMGCADCGDEVAPQRIEVFQSCSIYAGRCSCGAVLYGFIGPPEIAAEFHAYMAVYMQGHGFDAPRAVVRPLPEGWTGGAPIH